MSDTYILLKDLPGCEIGDEFEPSTVGIPLTGYEKEIGDYPYFYCKRNNPLYIIPASWVKNETWFRLKKEEPKEERGFVWTDELVVEFTEWSLTSSPTFQGRNADLEQFKRMTKFKQSKSSQPKSEYKKESCYGLGLDSITPSPFQPTSGAGRKFQYAKCNPDGSMEIKESDTGISATVKIDQSENKITEQKKDEWINDIFFHYLGNGYYSAKLSTSRPITEEDRIKIKKAIQEAINK